MRSAALKPVCGRECGSLSICTKSPTRSGSSSDARGSPVTGQTAVGDAVGDGLAVGLGVGVGASVGEELGEGLSDGLGAGVGVDAGRVTIAATAPTITTKPAATATRTGRGMRCMQRIVQDARLAEANRRAILARPATPSTHCADVFQEPPLSRTAQADHLRPHPIAASTAGWDGRAAAAAALSFLVPGLGQAYNHQPVLAWLLVVPVLLLVLMIGLALVLPDVSIVTRFLDIRFLVAVIVLDGALLGWRLVAIIQAYAQRQRWGRRGAALYVVGVLVLATLAMHAVPAYYAVKTIDTLNAVALGGDDGGFSGDDSGLGGGVSFPIPSTHPEVSGGERVNLLLVGVDSGFGRPQALTDTMLVVSIDSDGRSAMISVPRDLYGAPLPDGRTFGAKLNSLFSTAESDPENYPLGGVGTLKVAIGDLLGLKIHYFAAVNLIGFKQAIDAIGGVNITVARRISDPIYSEDGIEGPGFYLDPGRYHMDGSLALAYVRSRHGPGDSDFTRAERQQEVLTAVRNKLTAGNLLVGLPGLLDAVKNTISTDIPSARLPALAQAVQDADMSQVERAVIQPPLVTPESDPVAGYILHPDLEAIRALVREFTADQRPSEASPRPSD